MERYQIKRGIRKINMNPRIVWYPALLVCLMSAASCGLFKAEEEIEYEDSHSMQMYDGTRVYFTLSVPKSYSPDTPTPLILALHYGGQPSLFYGGDFMNMLVKPALKELRAIILAPTVPAGGSWTNSTSRHAVMALMDSVRAHYNIDSGRMLVTGFSLGGIGTWEFASRYSDIFCAAIPIASMPSTGIVDTISGIPLYVVHSKMDKIFSWRDVEDVVEQLQSRGLNVYFNLVEGIDHYETTRFVGPLREAVPWIRENW